MDAVGDEPCGSVADARDLDRRALEQLGLPGLVLMESAGAAAADAVMDWWSAQQPQAASAPRVTVVCGSGNNGGDGWVLARRLQDRASVLVLHAHAEHELAPDARRMRHAAEQCGVRATTDGDEAGRAGCDLVVDAVLGTGARRPVEGRAAELLRWIRQRRAGAVVIALDLPSGLDGDTGAADPLTPRCVLTVTFGLVKSGLSCGFGPDSCGSLRVADLGLPRRFRMQEPGAD